MKSAKALPKALGVVLVGSNNSLKLNLKKKKIKIFLFQAAVGLAYGSVVNASANYRGKKSDFANHAIASLISFPITGALARGNSFISS